MSQMLFGYDKNAKEFTSDRDNKENPNEGYSWMIFDTNKQGIVWTYDDFVISVKKWADSNWGNEVKFESVDSILDKGR